MQLITSTTSRAKLREMARAMFGNMVKAVVDIENNLLVVDADLHTDEEAFLIEQGWCITDQYVYSIHIAREGGSPTIHCGMRTEEG